jgi:hypothetical protein
MRIGPLVRMSIIALLLTACFLPLSAQTNVLMYHNNLARTGANLTETTLTPANINYNNFGKLWFFSTDGWVDAQPLYISGFSVPNQGTHNVLLIATENDSVYEVDANTGAQLWHTSLVPSGETPSDDRDCEQIYPAMGISSTPAIYLKSATAGGFLYAEAMTVDSSGNYHHRLHVISLGNGAERPGSPVEIQATYPSSGPQSSGGVVTFNPAQYKARPALTLLNGIVYVEFSSNCDDPPYSGWILGYNAGTFAQEIVFNVTPNGNDGALWGSGGGPAADGEGNLYFMVANGTFDSTLNANGLPIDGDFGNAFVKLAPAGGTMSVLDYFASYNAADGPTDENVELGSSSPIVLPAMTNSSGQTENLLVGAGKPGTIFVVNRNDMGQFNPTGNDSNVYQAVVGKLGPGGDGNAKGGVRFPMAFYEGYLYVGANLDPLLAFRFSHALLSAGPVSRTPEIFSYPGAGVSVSANGLTNAILWAVGNGNLYAYSATNLEDELYNSTQAPNGRDQIEYVKFAPPTIANGMVYVATQTGVAAFGELPNAGQRH